MQRDLKGESIGALDVHLKGQLQLVDISLWSARYGKVIRIVVLMPNITARKQGEEGRVQKVQAELPGASHSVRLYLEQ